MVSTHSRLKAAGSCINRFIRPIFVSTHSRLKAAGGAVVVIDDCAVGFQHTAA